MTRSCPRCDRPVSAREVACPYCNTSLNAYGHPGMPLYQAGDREYLCECCLYHRDNSCTYPQRPHAKSCILFHDIERPLTVEKADYKPQWQAFRGIRMRCYYHRRWAIVAVLIGISIAITLLR